MASDAEIETRLQSLEAEVRELAHDLGALASLLGQSLGEPFRAQARAILATRQTREG